MGIQLDFQRINHELLPRLPALLETWFPSGRLVGKEYTLGNLRGEPGDSLKINTLTGAWADFSSGEKGGDPISLFAAIHGLNQGESANRLCREIGLELGSGNGGAEHLQKPVTSLAPPPPGAVPDMAGASMSWCYRDFDGNPLYYVARYDKNGKKEFRPFSWDGERKKWVNKSWPAPRPLFNCDKLAKANTNNVLVVEGEKAASAAELLVTNRYTVVTWPNGSNSWGKTDWRHLIGKDVLIWPDADEPGVKAARGIATFLVKLGAKSVKIIDVSDHSAGFDAADAVLEGWQWAEFLEWAKPRAIMVETTIKTAEPRPVREKKQKPSFVAPTEEELTEEADRTAAPQPPGGRMGQWRAIGIQINSKGEPVNNLMNVYRVIKANSGNDHYVWFDEFHGKYFTRGENGKPREWTDADDLRLTALMQDRMGFKKASIEIVNQAVRLYGNEIIKNEVKDWLNTLTWDGVNRCDSFFCDCFGVKLSEYTVSASRNWWISIAARAMEPGCKVDNMVILEGGQGKQKSTALEAIGGSWFTEAQESVNSKDFYLMLQGKLIVEIAELDAFSKAETSSIKKVISCRIDRFRPPYGRAAMDFPRRCIFVGSTNERAYLRDVTGARRFWPIRIGKIVRIDLDRIREQREQLFAEAVVRYKRGESWWIMPEEETAQIQESRRQGDTWEQVIDQWLRQDGQHYAVLTTELIGDKALGLSMKELDRRAQNRIAAAMHLLGWKNKPKRLDKKTVKKVWHRDGELHTAPPATLSTEESSLDIVQ